MSQPEINPAIFDVIGWTARKKSSGGYPTIKLTSESGTEITIIPIFASKEEGETLMREDGQDLDDIEWFQSAVGTDEIILKN